MKVDIRQWRKGDPEDVLKLSDGPFAVMDPGAQGVMMSFIELTWWGSKYEPSIPPPPLVLREIRNYDGAVSFAEATWRTSCDPRVLFVEEPFAGRANVQSALKTASTAGFAMGAFMGMHHEMSPTIVMLPAQSWQAKYIPRALGDREARKRATLERAEAIMGTDTRWLAANKETRSAIADGLGMATWWAMMRRPELFR